MKKYALVMCAAIWALGTGAVATAQAAPVAAGAGTAQALGNAQAVDETALAIGDQAAAAQSAQGQTALPSNLAYFLRMILVLALVLGAMYLVFKVLKRIGKPKAADDSSIRILASASIGAGRALHVVTLGEKAYLLGATDSSISLIDRVEDREYLDALALKAATEAGAPRADFAAILGSLLPKGKKAKDGKGRSLAAGGFSGDEAFEARVSADYLAEARERVKKLRP